MNSEKNITITFVRHTSLKIDGRTCYGQSDIEVNDTFQQEAEEVAKNLNGLTFEKVFTSPLSRARKLASFCGYPDAIEDPRVMEMNFGDWELTPWNDIMGTYADNWFSDWIHTNTPNGESLLDLYKRVIDFIEEKKSEGLKNILVFCHGGVINMARTYAGECELKDAFIKVLPYGSIVPLKY